MHRHGIRSIMAPPAGSKHRQRPAMGEHMRAELADSGPVECDRAPTAVPELSIIPITVCNRPPMVIVRRWLS